MSAFRYKTASPEARKQHLLELKDKRQRAKTVGLARSALRFIEQADFKRGCSWRNGNMTQWEDVKLDLIALTEEELKTGSDHIHIPRKVARAYLADDYIPLDLRS